jgi:hypothetical protein
MIHAMQGATTPRLIFVAPSTISEEGRHELFSIAGTLSTQLHGTPIEVSVRFADTRQISGLHPVIKSLPQQPQLGNVAVGLPVAAEVA